MKFCLSVILLCVFTTVFSQNKERLEATFGRITQNDYELNVYEKDTTASAVVLYESGKNTFDIIKGHVRLIKNVHKKIKVFDANNFDGTEISIPFYHNESTREKIITIKAITHNGIEKKSITKDDVYEVDLSERWSEKRFVLPDVQDGSIIEYTYTIESPFLFNFGNWEFQEDIPKIYSEFSAEIPGNYVYNRSISGVKKLDVNEVKIKKHCFEVEGVGTADCDHAIYAMYDVPVYKEEPHMLSKENYISRLSYQLTESMSFDGVKKKYAKTWDDVDKEFRGEKDIGRQLKYDSYFKKVMPEEIFQMANKKERAKAVYNFIKDHYTWDGKYRIFSDIRVKEAFQNKKGNIAEINLSLINALQAANIKTHLALSSIRTSKVPSSVFPVLTEYNYVLAHVEIGSETYLLDATHKSLSFGILPYKVFNANARVMDFDNGSYWFPISSKSRNASYVKTIATINENFDIEGKVKSLYSGQLAYRKRQDIINKGTDVLNIESVNFELFDETIENLNNEEKNLQVEQTLLSTVDMRAGVLYINPFILNTQFNTSPFQAEKRTYPINLGYPYEVTYVTTLKLDENYSVISVPKNTTYIMPGGEGECNVIFSVSDTAVESILRFQLKKEHFSAADYVMLQSFYEGVVNVNSNSIISIKKM
ncbi:DUF3857 domain-containing protein [uncultured Dokdonia sp.]|uniref:DUF3857 domain-containing protein n=1 Tax=uncultured Dokdonia sp. TaxID=575653 RepID=UPI0026375082|nr:DUF3857 domain-containing protein [uncultured Dokdonia sp.]